MPKPVAVSDFCDPDVLAGLRDFLLSSMGPRGSAKALVGSGGHLTLATTSQRILRNLDLSGDPCCEAILAALRSGVDAEGGGLYLGALTCELTRLLGRLEPRVAADCTEIARRLASGCLLDARVRLDWGSSEHVLAVARGVLASKPWIPRGEVESLCLGLVRGFLATMPEKVEEEISERRRRSLRVKVVHGRGDAHRLMPGFVHRYNTRYGSPTYSTCSLIRKLELSASLVQMSGVR